MDDGLKLMTNIIREIFDSEKLENVDWTEFSIVFSFDGDGDLYSTYGYQYELSDKWHAFSITARLVENSAMAYERFLRPEGDAPMKKMLFQFNRETNRVNTECEYEDVSRWQVTPANLKTIIEELRPSLT